MYASLVILIAMLAGFAALNLLLARWGADSCYGSDPRCDWNLD